MSGSDPRVGERLGRYRLLEVLGRGGMGTVFRARDDELERDVAIKVILPAYAADPEFRERFRREAVVLSQMNSPHVVAVHDHGERDGAPYLVTQLVAGGDLFSMLTADGVVEPGRAVDLVAQVLQGLADAHAIGVVHRDVKPSNVLLSADGQAILCDFGIASSPGSDLTRTGTMIGSAGYMAPERHSAGSVEDAGVAGDVYAVGCLLWAMLAGGQPYVGSDAEVAMGHLHGPVPQFPGSSPFLDQINRVLKRSLAKDPAQRYPSARAMLVELEKARPLAASGVVVPDVTAVRQSLELPKPVASRRRRALTAALVAVLVLAGVYVGSLIGGVEIMPAALTGDDEPSAASTTDGSALEQMRSKTPGAVPSEGDLFESPNATAPPGVKGEVEAPPGAKGSTPRGDGSQTTKPKDPGTTSPRKPKAPPAAPKPAYQCWTGKQVQSLSECSLPTGRAGANWVFSGASNFSCSSANYSSAGFIEGYSCKFGKNTIALTRWTDGSSAKAYMLGRYEKKYNVNNERWIVGGVDFGRALGGRVNGDEWHSGRIYQVGPNTNAWAVAVRAQTFDQRSNLYDKLSFRLPSQFRGFKLN